MRTSEKTTEEKGSSAVALTNFMDIVERIKRTDMRLFAARFGYFVDRRESKIGETVMRHRNGDKIVISRSRDQHFVYCSAFNDFDNGSVFDFLMKRRGLDFKQALFVLSQWVRAPRSRRF